MKHLTTLLLFALITLSIPPSPFTPAQPVQPLQPSTASTAPIPLAEPPQPVTVAQEPQAYYPLTDWERALICRVMMSECAGEPYNGQMAVAQVILDRSQSPDYPDTVYEVLTQENQFASPSEDDITPEISEAVEAVFGRGERVVLCEILYFYAERYGLSEWHEAQNYVATIENHKFYN